MKVSLKYDKKQCWLLYNIADSADALYHADYMDVHFLILPQNFIIYNI